MGCIMWDSLLLWALLILGEYDVFIVVQKNNFKAGMIVFLLKLDIYSENIFVLLRILILNECILFEYSYSSCLRRYYSSGILINERISEWSCAI